MGRSLGWNGHVDSGGGPDDHKSWKRKSTGVTGVRTADLTSSCHWLFRPTSFARRHIANLNRHDLRFSSAKLRQLHAPLNSRYDVDYFENPRQPAQGWPEGNWPASFRSGVPSLTRLLYTGILAPTSSTSVEFPPIPLTTTWQMTINAVAHQTVHRYGTLRRQTSDAMRRD